MLLRAVISLFLVSDCLLSDCCYVLVAVVVNCSAFVLCILCCS